MRLEINTNGSWRVVSTLTQDHVNQVKSAIATLAAFLPDDPAWKITDDINPRNPIPVAVAFFDPRRHGLVWQERKR